jgi:CheY-like chemotaxis protein
MLDNRIMVVDDEPDLLRMVELYLRSWKFEVDSFTNPIEALAHFQENPSAFSLLLTDIRMPQMTGVELAQRVLWLKPEMKVMLMTAYEVDSLTFQSGLPLVKHEDILKKPFRLAEICEGVKKQLQISY